MQQTNENTIRFGPYVVSADRRLRCADGRLIRLSRRLHRLLWVLAEAQGRAVKKDELVSRCWPNTEVDEQNLSRAISDLRKLLKHDGEDPIKNAYGIGYYLEVESDLAGNQDRGSEDARPLQLDLVRLEAQHRIYSRRAESLSVAERLLQQSRGTGAESAHQLDIAIIQVHRMQLGYATGLSAWPRLRSAAEAAEQEFPAEALSLQALGLCWAEWDFSAADIMLERARRIDPTGYAVNRSAGLKEQMVGNNDLAVHRFRVALESNPMALATSASLVLTLALQGNADEAEAEIRNMVRKDFASSLTLGFRALFEARLGDPSLAVAPATQAFEALPESSLFAAILAYALSAAGDRDAALDLLARPSNDGETFGNSCAFACWTWLRLDLPNRALETLQRSVERRCPHLPVVLRDPAMAPILDQQQFQAIFRTVFSERSVARFGT